MMGDVSKLLSLNPCPFCGEINWLRFNDDITMPDKLNDSQVYCPECNTTGPQGFGDDCVDEAHEEAIKLWNTRPEEERLRQENERLREAASALLKACIEDMGDQAEFDNEDLSVGGNAEGDCAVTFKMMADLKEALNDTE